MTVSKLQNAISKHLQIEVFSCRYCTYLTVSQHEYVIPEHQQITPLAGLLCLFQNIRSLYTRFLTSANQPSSCTALPIFQCFAPWKRDSWEVANQPPCRALVPIFERFTVWRRDSWISSNGTSSRITQAISERFAIWKRKFLSISKSTTLHYSYTHIRMFPCLKT